MLNNIINFLKFIDNYSSQCSKHKIHLQKLETFREIQKFIKIQRLCDYEYPATGGYIYTATSTAKAENTMEVGPKSKNEKILALVASYCLLDMPGTMLS